MAFDELHSKSVWAPHNSSDDEQNMQQTVKLGTPISADKTPDKSRTSRGQVADKSRMKMRLE